MKRLGLAKLVAAVLIAALAAAPAVADVAPPNRGGGISQPVGTDNFQTGQPSVGTSGTQIVPGRPGPFGVGRVHVTLVNQCAQDAFIGPTAGVTTSTGGKLKAGASVTLETTAALYGVVASGTCEIDPWEEY